MGGTICVGIRHTLNGAPEEVFLFCHTNPLVRTFMTRDFLLQGERLKVFLDEDEDAERIPGPRLKDNEYGFVLIDFVTKRLFTQNHYTRYGYVTCSMDYPVDKGSLACLLDLLEHDMLDDPIEAQNLFPSFGSPFPISLETARAQLPRALELVAEQKRKQDARYEEIKQIVNSRKRDMEQIARLEDLALEDKADRETDRSKECPLLASLLTTRLSPTFFAIDFVPPHPTKYKWTYKEVRSWARAQGWKTKFGRS